MIFFLIVSSSVSLQLYLYANSLPITVCVQSYYKRVCVNLSLQCLLNYSLKLKKRNGRREIYPQIHNLMGVSGLSLMVTINITVETITKAEFHIMSRATTGFE